MEEAPTQPTMGKKVGVRQGKVLRDQEQGHRDVNMEVWGET